MYSKYGKTGIKKNLRLFNLTYKQELIGVTVVVLFIFFAISLISYNSGDNTWFTFSSRVKSVSNWCGGVGAHLAGFLFFLLGSASYLFLVSLFLMGLAFCRVIALSSLRVGALYTLVILSSVFFHMHRFDFVATNPGGVVGEFLSRLVIHPFGVTGGYVLLYGLMWVSLLLVARVSLVYWVMEFGKVLGSFVVIPAWQGLLLFGSLVSRTGYRREEPVCPPQILSRLLVPDESSSVKLHAGKTSSNTRPFFHWSIRCMRNAVCVCNLDGVHVARVTTYKLPDVAMFVEQKQVKRIDSEFEKKCREQGEMLEEKLLRFGVRGNVVAIRPGPVITLFEYRPDIDSKISKIVALEDDLAMALTAVSIRIIAPIPGKDVIGFEISNPERDNVYITEVLQDKFLKKCALPLAFGVDITGNIIVNDLMKMPHLLVAGATGSGKSVSLNAMLFSLLCRMTPDELKIILIDPKRLEFAPYADIPHLLFPIVTNPRQAIPILKWVVQEMEDRYERMARIGVRNISDYQALKNVEPMPFMVIIIDELADLMMVAGKDVEVYMTRIAQMARAAGIHMIVATQRPSIDVLTGTIKVNFPARMAFRVSSKIDSRTILDSSGAEKLLGRGDMLFVDAGASSLQRIHGAYVSTSQISALVTYLKRQQAPAYLNINEVLRQATTDGEEYQDDIYDEVKNFVQTTDEISISLLQRRYRIGFNRSARIIEKLEQEGIITPSSGGKMRKVIR